MWGEGACHLCLTRMPRPCGRSSPSFALPELPNCNCMRSGNPDKPTAQDPHPKVGCTPKVGYALPSDQIKLF